MMTAGSAVGEQGEAADAVIDHVPVASSSVASVGYLPEAKTLEVCFCTGTRYRYFDVPDSIFALFVAAPSKGVFFNAAVRGRFGYARI